MGGNSIHRFRNTAVLAVCAIDAPLVVSSAEMDDRLAAEGFHAPLDLVDGAARVYHPIVAGEAGDDLFGCFLKDYREASW